MPLVSELNTGLWIAWVFQMSKDEFNAVQKIAERLQDHLRTPCSQSDRSIVRMVLTFSETQRPFFLLGSGFQGSDDHGHRLLPQSTLSPVMRYHGKAGLYVYGRTGGEPGYLLPFSSSMS